MPDQFTHFLIAKKTLELLRTDEIDEKAFFLGSQGADLLYYTEAFGSKTGTEIGFILHRQKTGLIPSFFAEFAEKHPEQRKTLISYGAGFITHFWGDALLHPFIIYHTGVFILHKPETVKSRYRHKRMESAMDFIFARWLGIVPPVSNFNPFMWYLKYKMVPDPIRRSLHWMCRSRFDIDKDVYMLSGIAYHGMKLYAYLFYPPTKARRLMIRALQRLIPFVPWRTYLTVTDPPVDFTNREHKVWYHPCLPNKPRRESIFDLFEEAVGRSTKSITEYLKSPLKTTLPNLSLENGLEGPCEYKIFEIIDI